MREYFPYLIIKLIHGLIRPGQLLLIPAFFICTSLNAQEAPDTLKVTKTNKVVFSASDTLPADTTVHSPKKAAMLSAVLPGLGQVYNKKYWKVPVIYAGLGTLAYFAVNKQKNHIYYRDQLRAKLDDDPATIDEYPDATADQVLQVSESYRRNRDLLIIISAGVYVLNILDASVDAHLYTFDVSDDLSFRAAPSIITLNGINAPGLGLTLKF